MQTKRQLRVLRTQFLAYRSLLLAPPADLGPSSEAAQMIKELLADARLELSRAFEEWQCSKWSPESGPADAAALLQALDAWLSAALAADNSSSLAGCENGLPRESALQLAQARETPVRVLEAVRQLGPEAVFGRSPREILAELQRRTAAGALKAALGQWPGDETDEQITAALEELS
jgi:broad specificity phosphatase PhoE